MILHNSIAEFFPLYGSGHTEPRLSRNMKLKNKRNPIAVFHF